jgi:CheY-like chemotaxis protein
MHGGDVEAFSAGPNQGSEFVITLPLTAAALPVRVETVIRNAAETGDSGGWRVLVVDDNVDAARSLAMLLELRGLRTWTAHDGPTAIKTAEQVRPDLILLDIGLPQMDGYEVARRIRRIPDLQRTILAALTGYGRAEDLQLSRDAGFDHHLVKPVDLGRLDKLLSALQPATSAS